MTSTGRQLYGIVPDPAKGCNMERCITVYLCRRRSVGVDLQCRLLMLSYLPPMGGFGCMIDARGGKYHGRVG